MSRTPALALSYWQSVSAADKAAARARLTAAVNEDMEALVETFYSTFLQNDVSSAFLSHSVVQERLSGSLRNWLLRLLEIDPLVQSDEFEALQLRIGEVHARINIPNHLVMAGGTLLKTEIARRIVRVASSKEEASNCLILLDELVDYAMRMMSAAYDTSTREAVKDKEAYRYLALGEDIELERESQRAALMEWSQSVLFSLLAQSNISPFKTLSASPFGLWMRHRAKHLFSGSQMLEQIDKTIREIDETLLPAIHQAQGSPDLPALITRLQEQVAEITFLRGTLFQSAATIESGRDPLTRTLNRRFLPALLGREISLAKSGDVPLSVLMVDIDHFKQVNDTHGHSAGDTVLKHVADTILESVRSSDFVFRYGGEEFLIVLVETPPEIAFHIAQRLCSKVAEREIPLPEAGALNVTVSVGLAAHEGHPDPKYLIDRADRALYRAKSEGRNRVVAV